ncbi:MAG TPA: mechanosensitive ion channel domain-containing protein [Burkholderiaceae bacterium]|nr:mechanosensitive ion channel domain-containing protein [Burkholderiaceae bacterium]
MGDYNWMETLRSWDIHLFTLGGTSFTVLSALKLVLALILLFLLAGRARHFIVHRALARLPLEGGTRQSIGSAVRYVVLVVGIVVILQNAGINLTAFSVVAGALGVGIGFGLQNLFSNFISGLIIMLERPIKVGDRVELAGIEGVVQEIGARRTTVVTNDNVAILVPNQKFITDNVINHFYLEREIRLRLPVNVAAGAAIREVERVLLQAAAAHPAVLQQPAPKVLLLSLGAGTSSFELQVWFHPQDIHRQQLQSDLNLDIGDRLREAGLTPA